MSFSFEQLIHPQPSLTHVACISAQQKSNQQQFKPTAASPALLVLTTICTSRSGSAFFIAITTWPLSLASWVPSTSMTTPGITFLGGAGVVSELLDVDLVASMLSSSRLSSLIHETFSYISSSSWEGTSSTFACIGTAKSTNKSCHLLNYVAWIAGTSGPSRLDRSILPTCLLHIWLVYICSNHNVLTTSYTNSRTSGCRGSTGTCNSSDIV